MTGAAEPSIDEVQTCLVKAGLSAHVSQQSFSTASRNGSVPAILVGPREEAPTAIVIVLHRPTDPADKVAAQVFQEGGGTRLSETVFLVPWIPDLNALKPVGKGVRARGTEAALNEVPGIDRIRDCAAPRTNS